MRWESSLSTSTSKFEACARGASTQCRPPLPLVICTMLGKGAVNSSKIQVKALVKVLTAIASGSSATPADLPAFVPTPVPAALVNTVGPGFAVFHLGWVTLSSSLFYQLKASFVMFKIPQKKHDKAGAINKAVAVGVAVLVAVVAMAAWTSFK